MSSRINPIFVRMSKFLSPITRIDRLNQSALTILEREVSRLMELSIATKLGTSHSKDLRDYIYLLTDLKKTHQTRLAESRQRKQTRMATVPTEQLEQALGLDKTK